MIDDLEIGRLKTRLNRQKSKSLPSVSEMRIGLDRAAVVGVSSDVSVEPLLIGGLKAEWIRPKAINAASTILYFHGGGFVAGSCASHRHLAVAMALATGARVLLVEYRLAPEHPFPAAIDDAIESYRWLLETGISGRRIAVAGDSAGGGIALALAQRVRDEGDAPPACVALLSPWLDLTLSGPNRDGLEQIDPTLTSAALANCASLFEGTGYRPLDDRLNGLPPLLVQAGSEEILYDDAIRLYSGVSAIGGSIELQVGEGLFHVWQAFVPRLPEARAAVERLGMFFKAHFED